MNIILSLLISVLSVAVAVKYRPRGKAAVMLFRIALLTAFAMLFTNHTFADVWAWLVTAADICCAAFILAVFRSEARLQAAARARRRAEARKLREEQEHAKLCRAERIRRVSLCRRAENFAA